MTDTPRTSTGLSTGYDHLVAHTLLDQRRRMAELRRRLEAIGDTAASRDAEPCRPGTRELRDQSAPDAGPTPGFCCFGVTDYCMLKCEMCDKWHTDIFVEEKVAPSLAQWKAALTSLRRIVPAGFEVDFGGGEALSHKGLLDMVSHATSLGLRTCLASNGWTINEDMARRIADSGLSSIILSIDSLDPKVHDRFRGKDGVLDQVMRAIDFLDRASPDIHIGTCSIIMEHTLPGILDIAEWANRHHRLKSALFMAVMQPNNTEIDLQWQKGEFGAMWPRDVKHVDEVLGELIRMRKSGYYIGNSVPQLEAFRQYFAAPERFVKTTPCNMDKAVHVSAVGDVFLCFRKSRVGNIRDNSDLAEYWTGETAGIARQAVRDCDENCHFLLNCYFEADYPFQYDGAHLKRPPPPPGPKSHPVLSV